MSSSAENNFRNAFKNFGARGGVSVTDPQTSTEGGAFSRASDWFGGVRSQVSGYVPVSLGGSSGQQEEDFLGLTWFQRMAGFAICALGGVACFMVAIFMGLPLLPINPGKFAISFTFGSILMMCSFALLRGPMTHFRTITSRERLPFTGAYFASMAFTLYAAFGIENWFLHYALVIIGAVIQLFALLWYFTSYNPFGGSIRLGSRMTGLLPV